MGRGVVDHATSTGYECLYVRRAGGRQLLSEACGKLADQVAVSSSDEGALIVAVNPYSFVPLPGSIERTKPVGHDNCREGLKTGWIEVSYTARSPLLIGDGGNWEGEGFSDFRPYFAADGQRIYPGSSMHGAIRNLFETLSASCLRVVSLDYVATHRDSADAGFTASMLLAVVKGVKHDDGAKKLTGLSVQLCDDLVWVDHRLFDRSPCTGDRLTLEENGTRKATGSRFSVKKKLQGLSAKASIDSEGDRVVLVSDTKPKARNVEPYFVTGKLSEEPRDVLQVAIDNFNMVVERAQDRKETPGSLIAVKHQKTKREIGQRLAQTYKLQEGQPIWVELDEEDRVASIRLAQLWRRSGEGTISQRLGPVSISSPHPCGTRDGKGVANCASENGALLLCPACQVFGAADEADSHQGASTQHSYRGHVFIDDFRVTPGPGGVRDIKLAPLSGPKASSGQMYLDNKGWDKRHATGWKPLSTWGSEADSNVRRKLRGRKYYHPSAQGLKRAEAADQTPSQLRQVQLLPEETTLTGRITFEDLTDLQLAQLLCAVDPNLLFHGQSEVGEYVLRVGGGKPFGLGSLSADITNVVLYDGNSRYTDGASTQLKPHQFVPDFWDHIPGRHSVALELLSRLDAIQEEINYPALDDGDEFFKKSRGDNLPKDPSRRLLSLPPADSARDQAMPKPAKSRG